MASKKKLKVVCHYDRISNLPDHLLSHILSFLETKYSVRTRILSKRWKHLYTLVPILNFNHSEAPGQMNRYRRLNRFYSFLNFVNWVFNSYNVDQMDRFFFIYRYSSRYLANNFHLPFWISEAVRRGVRVLYVCQVLLERELKMLLPSCIFTCETLSCLKIHGRFDVEVPDNVSLPHVKTLKLFGVTFTDGCSASKLLRSFPVLEDLNIHCYFKDDNPVLFISIPTLKSLEVYTREWDFEFVFDVPNVVHVEFSGAVTHMFSVVQGFKLLRKACIEFDECSKEEYEVLEKIVTMICHVRHLCVSPYTLMAVEKSGRTLPVFYNLTHLEIKQVDLFEVADPGLVLDLLNKTPRLEVLVLDKDRWSGYISDENNQQGQLFQKDVPTCVSQHLKRVEFKGFSMLKYECELVEYFLKNAKILDVLKILSFDDLEKRFELSKKLLTFTRCSNACQIVINQGEMET